MSKFLRVLGALPILVAGFAPAFASSISPLVAPSRTILVQHNDAAPKNFKIGALSIEAPWIRATPGGAKVAGGYMKIVNHGTQADRLIGGSLPVAGRFEVHEMAVENGVMRMRELARGLEIAPGAAIELKPGSYHAMFMDLKQGLKEGETIKGTLVFEKAGKIEIEYRVEPLGGGHMRH
jgi:copper(I)-binding protein